MTKPRSSASVDSIRKYVAAGYSQSAANCRVLLDEIDRLNRVISNRDSYSQLFEF